jgi:hypothetical protein
VSLRSVLPGKAGSEQVSWILQYVRFAFLTYLLNLLRECVAEADRFSAVSTSTFPANSRFGFLSAEIASFSSASILTFFFALAFKSEAKLPKSTSRRENRFEFSTPPLFAASGCDSAKGIPESEGASLASLFNPGTDGIVADLINEIARSEPRDTLRRSRSSVNTRCKLRRGFTGTGRLVAAPGLEGPEKLEDLDSLGFGGEIATGPPSLRLIAAQRSGRRAEKL